MLDRGQVIERGSNKFLIRAYHGRIEGQRKYVSRVINGTRKEAEAALTALLAQNDSGELPQPSTVTLGEFLNRWLNERDDLRQKTREDYEGLMSRHVLPALGRVHLQRLQAQHIQSLYGSLFSDRQLSARTIQYIHAVLHSALERARKWNLIRFNPADQVTLPRRPKKEMLALSPSMTKQFLSATKEDRLGTLWHLLLTTGLRPSEALALQWRDLEGEWLVVRRTIAAEGLMDEGKTEGATRRIGVPASLQMILEVSRGLPEAFIWPTRSGHWLDLSTVRKEWKKALVKAGLPSNVRLYDTRHTHATHLLSKGVNVKALAHRLGHGSPELLLKTYAHVLPEVEQESAAITQRILEEAA